MLYLLKIALGLCLKAVILSRELLVCVERLLCHLLKIALGLC